MLDTETKKCISSSIELLLQIKQHLSFLGIPLNLPVSIDKGNMSKRS